MLALKNESGRPVAPQFDMKIVWRAFTQEPHQELSYFFTRQNLSAQIPEQPLYLRNRKAKTATKRTKQKQ